MVTPCSPATVTFGELLIEHDGETVVLSVAAQPGQQLVDIPLSELREWVRTDDAGRYRPLAGARSIRTGWRCTVRGEAALREACDAVYPLALRHQELRAAGALAIVPLDTVLERQRGRYAPARALSAEGRAAAGHVLCSQCIKEPLWAAAPTSALSTQHSALLCPEPCSVLVSLCREAALWEGDPAAPAPVDPSIPFAAFDRPGNEIREAYLRARAEGAIDG